jgi:hypothetical protein
MVNGLDMLIGLVIAGFLAWSFVCAFQAARKVPGRKWYGALMPGALSVAAVQAIGAFADVNGKVAFADRVAQVFASLFLMLVMAGIGAGVGWIFRPRV